MRKLDRENITARVKESFLDTFFLVRIPTAPGSFFLSFSQLFLGTVVNMSLIGSALYIKGKNLLPLIFLPGLAAVARGLIFGPLTSYLIYMMPFIRVGNTILVLSVKSFHLKKGNHYLVGALIGSVFKFIFLMSMTYLLYSLNIVPVQFLLFMALLQLVTACTASFAFFPIDKVRKKFSSQINSFEN